MKKFLGYAIVLVLCLVVCWGCARRVVDRNQDEAISKGELMLHLKKALARLDNFHGTVTMTSVNDGQTNNTVNEVVSKGTHLLYVSSKLNDEPSLSFVIKGDRGCILPKPGGELICMTPSEAAVTPHPSMQSFIAGVLDGLNQRHFVSSAKRMENDRIQVILKATGPDAEWIYELDARSFLVLKQHAHGPHGTGIATWTAIDTETAVSEEFFDNKIEYLRGLQARFQGVNAKTGNAGE